MPETSEVTERVATRPSTPPVLAFLIADVRDYTQFTVVHGDAAAAELVARFAQVTREIVEAREGTLLELRGDEALAVFPSARQAIRAAVELQDRFARESRADTSLPLLVGIGLDAGEAVPIEGGYRGAALNMAARLCSLAGPGEVLASETITAIARRLDGLEYRDRGTFELKGFADPVRVIQVVPSETDHTLALSSPEIASNLGEVSGPEDGITIASGLNQALPLGGFLGSLPQGRLVARDRELETVLAAVDDVAEGRGRTVMLAGEAGAGKTRLAQEVTRHLLDRGFIIAAGRCYEPEQTVPYYPFLDVLAMVYAAAPLALRREAPRRWPHLGLLLPEQFRDSPVTPGSGPHEDERLLRTVGSFFEAITEVAPLGLLLDDLHWADASSLKLVLHLARHTSASPVLLLATYRDVDVGRHHPLEGALRDLYRDGLVERVDVSRLDQAGTAALVASTMGIETITDEFGGLVYDRTEGNPYFVQQVLRVLAERGDLFQENGQWDRHAIAEMVIPESIRSVIGQRLSRLVETTQEVLHEASILGQNFSFDDLLAVSTREEDELERALEEAARAGLVRDVGHDAFSFDHALTRQAIYRELSSRRRRRLHLAAGEALERLPERKRAARVSELAWHFLHGNDTERACRYALEAGVAAEAAAGYSEAEMQYRTAAELAHEREDLQEARSLDKLGHVLRVVGRFDEAAEILERAITIYHELSRFTDEAWAVAEVGYLNFERGTVDLSIDRVRRAQAAIEDQGASALLGRLYQVEALYFWAKLELGEDFHESLHRALDIARQAGDESFLTEMLAMGATGERVSGRVPEALALLEEARTRAAAAGDLYSHYMAETLRAETYTFIGQLGASLDAYQGALDVARRMHNPGWTAYTLASRASTLQLLGDWDGARRDLDQAAEWERSAGDSWGGFFSPLRRGQLLTLLGEWEGAEGSLRQAQELAEHSHDRQWQEFALTSLAHLERLRGNLDRALEWLDRAPDITAEAAIRGWILLDLERLAEAERIARGALEEAGIVRSALAEAHGLMGAVLGAQHRWQEAFEHFEEGLLVATKMELPYVEAVLLREYGRMFLTLGEPEQARDRLTQSRAIFQRLGAGPDLDRTEQALAAITVK